MPFLPTAAFPVDLLPSGDVDPLVDVVWTGYHGDTVTVRARRRSDLGTVPKLLRGILPHDGKAARGFLVHDELCRLQHEYQAALDAWRLAHLPTEGPDVARVAGLPMPERPTPPAFDAVDTDAVLRVILAELGVGPVRWIYWEGVRVGALGSKARRRGFLRPRSVVPFVLLAVPTLVVVLPAAAGALVSRALLGVGELLAWPWEARARAGRRRASRVIHAEAAARNRVEIAAGSLTVGRLTAAVHLATARPIVLPPEGMTVERRDDGDREAFTGSALDRSARDYFGPDYPPEHGDHPNRPALVAFRAGWRRGVDRVREVEASEDVGHRTWITTSSVRKSGESATRTEVPGPPPGFRFIDLEPVAGPRRPGPVRRALTAPFRLLWRGLCAVGRGIAHVLYALLEAL